MSDPLTAARRLKFALACLAERDFAVAAEANPALLAATLERHEAAWDHDLAPTQHFRHARTTSCAC